MSAGLYRETLKVCQLHADRMIWAMGRLRSHLPFTAAALDDLSDISHEYPDDPALQAAIHNKAVRLADGLLSTLDGVKKFSSRYL